MSLKYPYGFIYEVSCLVNGRKYIGSHRRSQNDNDPDDQWYIGSSTNKDFWDDLEKYGRDNFVRKILEDVSVEDTEFLKSRECYYLKLYGVRDDPTYYNLTTSPYGGGACINKIIVHKGDIDKFINKDLINEYLSDGWELGSSDRRKSANSVSHKGIVNDNTVKLFKKMLIENNPMTNKESRYKVALSKLGKVWVHKNNIQTYINEDELEDYISLGYSIGMLKRSGRTKKDYLRTCKVCSVSYYGGKYSVYCPECYSKMRKEITRRFHDE